jgi:VanZ family protein
VLKFFFLALALLWTLLILILCFENEKDIPDIAIEHLDKVVHFIFHFVFTSLWFLYFKKAFQNNNLNKLLFVTWLLSLVFGLIIEFLQQQLTTTRNADSIDVLSNIVGASVAVFTFSKLKILQRI